MCIRDRHRGHRPGCGEAAPVWRMVFPVPASAKAVRLSGCDALGRDRAQTAAVLSSPGGQGTVSGADGREKGSVARTAGGAAAVCQRAGRAGQRRDEKYLQGNLQRGRMSSLMAGTLTLVGTPIGNLGDFSPRAVEALKECDFIAAEDSRVCLLYTSGPGAGAGASLYPALLR